MGSSGGKPRKPEQHHLPKVGTKANEAYEAKARRKEVFGPLPIVIIAVLIGIVFLGWIFIT
jgi:hypothetical protein